MGNVLFTSDLHFHHKNICKFRPQFETEEEHRQCVKDLWCSVVTKRDLVWVLGDSIFDPKGIDDINSLPGRKKLIMGNHCLERFDSIRLHECFESVQALHGQYGYWLSHAPIHPEELRGKCNLHGHTHYHCINDRRYMNVCLEQTAYQPISLDEVRQEFERRTTPIPE